MLYKSLASDFVINIFQFLLLRYIKGTQSGTRMASEPSKKVASSAMEEISGIIPPAELTPEANGRAPGRSRLKGKNILVVGGGQSNNDFDLNPPIGNGRAICLLLAREGAAVAVADISRAAADVTTASIQDEGIGFGTTIVGDVSTESGCKSIVQQALDHFKGQLDGLVIVVGILGAGPSYTRGSAEYFDRVMNINVRAHYLLHQAALPHIERSPAGGAAVSIGSIAAYLPASPEAAYHASKAALHVLVQNIAYQFAPKVRVNLVVPGLIDTPMGRSAGLAVKGRNASAIPLSRQGTGWDIAYAVLFLLSGESSFITAQEIIVDGGTLGTGGKRAKTPNTVTEI
jgi:NAD(P)-dependent dehydrogenase (short-subunit alcohol dehydrogenase family)